jgi:osmotically-inducible protein OsmY
MFLAEPYAPTSRRVEHERNGIMSKRYLMPALITTFMLLLPGCDEPPPESQLRSAGDKLTDTAENLEDVQREIDQLENRLQEMRRLQRELRAKEQSLQERVETRATDTALFRSVQSGLLDADELQDSAISVTAESGRITLNGTVSSEEQAEHARRIAGSVPGVASVRSQLRVANSQPGASQDGSL